MSLLQTAMFMRCLLRYASGVLSNVSASIVDRVIAACLQLLVQLLASLRRLESVMVLVTSRVALPEDVLGNTLQLRLPPLSDAAAAQLLASHAGGFGARLSRDLATKLARQCEGNALLLTVVGEEFSTSSQSLDLEVQPFSHHFVSVIPSRTFCSCAAGVQKFQRHQLFRCHPSCT